MIFLLNLPILRIHPNIFRNTLKQRFGYIQHPESGEYEKQEYNDVSCMDYPDYETAAAYRDEWVDIWQSYLDDQE